MSHGFRSVSQNPSAQLCLILSCQRYFLLAAALGFNSLSCRLFRLLGPFSPFPLVPIWSCRDISGLCVCVYVHCAIATSEADYVRTWSGHCDSALYSWLMKCLLHCTFITAEQLQPYIYTTDTPHGGTCRHQTENIGRVFIHMLIWAVRARKGCVLRKITL